MIQAEEQIGRGQEIFANYSNDYEDLKKRKVPCTCGRKFGENGKKSCSGYIATSFAQVFRLMPQPYHFLEAQYKHTQARVEQLEQQMAVAVVNQPSSVNPAAEPYGPESFTIFETNLPTHSRYHNRVLADISEANKRLGRQMFMEHALHKGKSKYRCFHCNMEIAQSAMRPHWARNMPDATHWFLSISPSFNSKKKDKAMYDALIKGEDYAMTDSE